MWLAKVTAGLVALVAITIGIVGKVDPWLFMNIKSPPFGPGPGLFLWIISGGPMPPYMDLFQAWQDKDVWLKKDDVVVAVGAKSGTTWMLYCTHQIRTKGSDEVPFVDVNVNTPWVELSQKPRQEWPEIKKLMNTTIMPDGTPFKDLWDHHSYPFRIFKSHATPIADQLNTRDKKHVKFIGAVRPGIDVVSSFAPFICNHNTEFLRMWGGMDALQANCANANPKDQLSSSLTDFLPGGNFHNLYFDYVKNWWPHRHDDNVLLMHYNDMVGDHDGMMRKLVGFLGVDLTPAEFDNVSDRCTYKYMKKHAEVSYHLPLNTDFPFGHIMNGSSLMHTGKSGRGKTEFTAEQQASWAAVEDDILADTEMKEWARNGGPLPA